MCDVHWHYAKVNSVRIHTRCGVLGGVLDKQVQRTKVLRLQTQCINTLYNLL